MKITIHSIDELKELVHIVAFGLAHRDAHPIAKDSSPYVAELLAKATANEPRIEGRPPSLGAPYGERAEPQADEPRTDEPRTDEPQADEPQADEPQAEMVDVDSRNLPHDERIHASTKAKNADGTWRARRGVNPELVAQVERELLSELIPRTVGERAEQREADEAAAVDAAEAAVLQISDRDTERPVDYRAIIKRAEARALDLAGDHRALMAAAQGFIAEYGHEAFNALRAAAVPDENGVGKAVQLLSPGERRLLEACIAEY